MEGWGQAVVEASEWGEGVQLHVHKKKLHPTDVILPSSHAMKLAYFVPDFVFEQNKKWKFSLIY